MTDKSICMKCLQLTRVWVKDPTGEREIRICPVKEIDDILWQVPNTTVTKCSQFLEATRERVEKLESVT